MRVKSPLSGALFLNNWESTSSPGKRRNCSKACQHQFTSLVLNTFMNLKGRTYATAKPQFSADVIQLPLLSRIQIFFRRDEVGAGVNHARIEPQRVELGRKIVVIADGLPVTISRMK
jgi:hypothetical protein